VEPVTIFKPGERLADFRIVRSLGRGGMGVVYLAVDERLDRQVALKVIAPDLAHDREFQERFEAEARSAAAIEHANAVSVYSAGNADDNLYIAMRYVEGTDLRRHLAEFGPLSPTAAAAVAAEVGAALDAAHAAGFVHRDVKPANILLEGAPGGGTAFLTDFGLTRGLGAANTQLTRTGQWIGTLDYVAPEQMAAGKVDARTDIYSLGCVLYEMLSGAVPYTGDEMQKLWGKANEEPPPLHPRGDHAFDPVLSRALARDPERRFRSAGDLGRAASAAAGRRVEAPTERSVATGVAEAGLLEADAPRRRALPERPTPYEQPTAQMQSSHPDGRRRSPVAAVAVVLAALAVAGGLVAGALMLAGDRGAESSTIVRKAEPVEETITSSTEEEPVTTEEPTEPVDEEQQAEAVASSASEREPYYGNLYTATIPADWFQEADEEVASDGSYVENIWRSPDETESLKIDASLTPPEDPTVSAEIIAKGLEDAGETVYAFNEDVVRGGLLGTEIQFHSSSGTPERADFFFNLGGNGFAVLGGAYDLGTARSLVGPLVRSLQPS
jgi:hypothetical protein